MHSVSEPDKIYLHFMHFGTVYGIPDMLYCMKNSGIFCTLQSSLLETVLAIAPAIRWLPMWFCLLWLHTESCCNHVCAEHAQLVLLHTHLVLTLPVRHLVT